MDGNKKGEKMFVVMIMVPTKAIGTMSCKI
jgi:hypothetical protein